MNQESLLVEEINLISNVQINSVYDLVNTKKRYPDAVPILLRHMSDQPNNRVLLEGIVRALATPDAKGVAEGPLLKLFYSVVEEAPLLGWTIGSTIEYLYDDSIVRDILEIVVKEEYGMSRQMFVAALGRTKEIALVEPVLVDLLEQESIKIQVLEALIKLNSKYLDQVKTELLNDKKKVVRKIAANFFASQ